MAEEEKNSLLTSTLRKYKFVVISLCIGVCYLAFRWLVINNSFLNLHIVFEQYSNQLLCFSFNIGVFFGIVLRDESLSKYISLLNDGEVVNYSLLSLKHIFLLIVLFVIPPIHSIKKLLLFIVLLALIYITIVLRANFIFIQPNRIELIKIIASIFNWGAIFIMSYYTFASNTFLLLAYNKTNLLLKRYTLVSPIYLAIFILFYHPFVYLVLNFTPKEALSDIILKGSKYFLSIIGFESVIEGRVLRHQGVWVYLGNPCLGLKLMTTYATLLIVLRDNILKKALAIIIGLFIIYMTNVIRIGLLLKNLWDNDGQYSYNLDLHDMFNYIVYTIIIVLWIVYLYFIHTCPKVFENRTL